MNKFNIIKQEYSEYILKYGYKFDTEILKDRSDSILIKTLNHFYDELTDSGIPILSNLRLGNKRTIDYINKTKEDEKRFFEIKPSKIEGYYQIFYNNKLEDMFKDLEADGYSIGSKEFVLPKNLEIKNYFSAMELSQNQENIKNDILNKGMEINDKFSDNDVYKLRNVGVRIFDKTIIFNNEKKKQLFLDLLNERKISEKNYQKLESKDLSIVNFDSVYLNDTRLNKILTQKNGFRKNQFEIFNLEKTGLNCNEVLIKKQNEIKENISKYKRRKI